MLGAFDEEETMFGERIDGAKDLGAARVLPLGRVVATVGAVDLLVGTDTDPATFLRRHALGDWGDLCDEDRRNNDEALHVGGRILSAYLVADTLEKVWVITEWDRSVTTLLLAEEY